MKRFSLAILVLLAGVQWAVAQSGVGGGGQSNVSGGGTGTSGSINATGPIVNVTNPAYAGCPAAAGADWVTCFTSATTALDNASLIGTPTVRASTNNACSSCTSLQTTFSTQAGDTVLVWFTSNAAVLTDTIGCIDSGGSVYRTISSATLGTSALQALIGTNPRAALASTSVTCTDNVARTLNLVIAAISNYGSERLNTAFTSASTSTPSISDASTEDANNLWLAGFNWVGAGVSASQNSGTIVQNVTNAGNFGVALVSNAVASQFGSATNSITLSGAQASMGIGIEIRSHSTVLPTLYIPPGDYLYSGGLSILHPGVLNPSFGARMCYTGSAHAVDFGPLVQAANSSLRYYILDGGYWTCGSNMTQGITFNPFTLNGGVRNAEFHNFGSSTSYMIAGLSDNFDIEVGPQNKFVVDDLIPRNLVAANLSHTDINSFIRIHDNIAVCGNVLTNCSGTTGGIGFHTDSSRSRVYHNNIAFFNPDIWVDCTNGSQCFGTNIESNQLESAVPPGGTILPVIQFSTGSEQLLVINNSVLLHGGGSTAFMGPRGGSDTMLGARINWNNTAQITNGVPLIILNNIAGQTGNQSLGNGCTNGLAGFLPCSATHTLGGNITIWNADYYPKFVFAAGTTATYTFGQANFSTTPVCTVPPNIPGTATTLTISTLNATTITITASASNSATVFGVCSAGDAQ